MSIHHAHAVLADSGIEANKDVHIAEGDLLRRVRLDHVHDVPLCAGMSRDGRTLFVDRFAYPMIVKLGYLAPLIVHEATEHLLMTYFGLDYAPAHAIATGAEEAAARSRGIDLTRYNRNWNRIILEVGKRRSYPLISPELDPQPYRQMPARDRPPHVGGLLES